MLIGRNHSRALLLQILTLVALPVSAADTVETWERGARDVETYIGYERRPSAGARSLASELVFGYMRHPSWDNAHECTSCFGQEELQQIESLIPGASGFTSEYILEDGSHSTKAGPCVRAPGLGDFAKLRSKLDGCLSGALLAKDRAAESIQKVMIPAALDYPQ